MPAITAFCRCSLPKAAPILRLAVVKRLPHFVLEVDLSCAPGSLTAIVGPSSAGKTTLIRMVAGLERPDQGVISLGETTWVDTARGVFLPPQKRCLGLVFQEYTLFPHLSVEKNVAFAARRKERVPALLELFGIPILHVTHDLDEARYLGDAIVPLVKGRIAPGWPERQGRLLAAMADEPLPRPCLSGV